MDFYLLNFKPDYHINQMKKHKHFFLFFYSINGKKFSKDKISNILLTVNINFQEVPQ